MANSRPTCADLTVKINASAVIVADRMTRGAGIARPSALALFTRPISAAKIDIYAGCPAIARIADGLGAANLGSRWPGCGFAQYCGIQFSALNKLLTIFLSIDSVI
jgi:hypothetical protein